MIIIYIYGIFFFVRFCIKYFILVNFYNKLSKKGLLIIFVYKEEMEVYRGYGRFSGLYVDEISLNFGNWIVGFGFFVIGYVIFR